ncbi:hypothetical protein J1N35_039707 [Gossypium stocksii]|uniref:Uncharacterized protein n=1 Tax=Gossypium stocksii TaxID=47602 RepID=A0A9D3ZI05_9ROSI|nr:hypothetical protein J1N35_039707 [Gossypium stocksii]
MASNAVENLAGEEWYHLLPHSPKANRKKRSLTLLRDYNLHYSDPTYYDIRKKCEGSLCYDFSNMETFLNKKSVRDALGVGNIEFVSCSPTVYQAMLVDWMRNLEVGIPALLEDGVKLLVYAGEYDLIATVVHV